MNLSASTRRHWGWWTAMAVLVIGLLVLAGSQTTVSGTGDDRLYALGEQLKCPTCHGESVSSSQTPLAEVMRGQIRERMATGATDSEILNYFAANFGTEVLLEPPTSGLSGLVWMLPVLVLGAAATVLGLAFKRWRSTSASLEESDLTEDSESTRESEVPSKPEPTQDFEPASAGNRRRMPLVGLGVVGFLVLAAWLVIGGSNDRGDGEITGGVGGSGTASSALSECQPQAANDPAAAIDCYDAVLADSPGDVEALSYRGWALVRSGDSEGGTADLEQAAQLDPTYPDARVFLAIVASDGGDFETAAAEMREFWKNDPSDVAVSVVQSEGLERKVFFGLISVPTRACWQAAAEQGGEDGSIDQAFRDTLGQCLDVVLAADPTDTDARLSRSLAYVGPDTTSYEAAIGLLDTLLAENPDNSDALALLVSIEIASGDLDAASANLEILEELDRGPGAFLIGDAATLRAAHSAARKLALPNPDGG